MSTIADARLVAAKDLRIEWRSRVALAQTLPFAVLVLVLLFRPTGLLGERVGRTA